VDPTVNTTEERLEVLEAKVVLQRQQILQLFDLCDRLMSIMAAMSKLLVHVDTLKQVAKEAKDRV